MYRIPGPIRTFLAVALLVLVGVIARAWMTANATKDSALETSGGINLGGALAIVAAAIMFGLLTGIRRSEKP